MSTNLVPINGSPYHDDLSSNISDQSSSKFIKLQLINQLAKQTNKQTSNQINSHTHTHTTNQLTNQVFQKIQAGIGLLLLPCSKDISDSFQFHSRTQQAKMDLDTHVVACENSGRTAVSERSVFYAFWLDYLEFYKTEVLHELQQALFMPTHGLLGQMARRVLQ